MTRLRRNMSANVLANVWSTALALVLTPAYVRLLGVESYGLIGFYVSWTAILGVLDTAISTTAIRHTAWLSARPGERHHVPSLLRSLEVAYWAIMLAAGVLLMIAAWYVGGAWFHTDRIAPSAIRTALMLMIAALVVQVPSGLYVGGLMGLQHQVEASALTAVFGTLRGLGAVAALVAVRADIRVFFAWQIVASALQTATMRFAMLRRAAADGDSGHFSPALLRSVRQFAGATSVVTALSLVLAQGDKLILSRLVSLETFGLYIVAWTIASGLTRIATPLLQAFSPRFTELLSRGDLGALSRQVRLASQLTNTLILPPAALIVALAVPLLTAWLGDARIAAGAAPLMSVLTIGTVFSACSYPALSILYSRGDLRPVIYVTLAGVVIILPLCIGLVLALGAMGAAVCWVAYGLLMYVSYQRLGLRGLPHMRAAAAIGQDFLAPAAALLPVAWLAWYCCRLVAGRAEVAAILAVFLLLGWAAALVTCRELSRLFADTLRWRPFATRWSA